MVLLEQYCHCKLRTVFLDSEKLLNHDKKALIKRFHTVIDVEGPILDDVLQLRVLNSYGLKKRGCNIQDFFDGLMEDLDR
ncbi:MAG: DUF3320 domain-containing protein, partial [Sphaerochaetaceae bacterium]|nr:DUF3320 domain-containing protein [Sphaerochaetaceae bacterium]